MSAGTRAAPGVGDGRGALPGAIVVGGGENGLAAVRALATEGVRVALVCTRPSDLAQHSRYVSAVHRLHGFQEEPRLLIDLLESHANSYAGWAVIPTNDYALAVLAQEQDRLARWYPPTVPSWPVTQQVVDKAITCRLARELGIDLPQSYGPAATFTEYESVRYPVIVKPVQGHLFWDVFGRKLFVAHTEAELRTAVEAVRAAALEAELFDLVPGPDDHVFEYSTYVDLTGEPMAEFAARKLRQGPPFYGVARAATMVDPAPLREPSLAMARRLGWRGLLNIEYKLDPRDGRYRLLEVNGRCFLSHGLAWRAGMNYPLLMWRERALGQAVQCTPNGWRGTWIHLHADLLYTAMCLGREQWRWRDFVRSYTGPRTFAVLSARDPKPSVVQWARTVKKAARVLANAGERSAVRARVQRMPAAEARA
ncbi:MAG TPA: hypothetical protein VFK13_04100 [Gemmatimonadaceae bacterium]|nr:hypothetical protein [Gemmatimonadaceae bacterium]